MAKVEKVWARATTKAILKKKARRKGRAKVKRMAEKVRVLKAE